VNCFNIREKIMAFDDTHVRAYLRTTHETSLLSEREKHLIGMAVTMTRGCQVCTRNRIEKARAAGIGDDVLNALIAVASSVNAGVTAATAREAFRAAEAAAAAECGAICSVEASSGR
jgi:alkylhydroperoxidase/carboxymuconolactone decarboxylase family protein YurZ